MIVRSRRPFFKKPQPKPAAKPAVKPVFVPPPMEYVTTKLGHKLKFAGGFWIAATDTGILRFLFNPHAYLLNRATYQYKQLSTALKYVKTHRVALDIGAHVGTWSRILAQQFDTVYAFEALPLHVECLRLNVPNHNVQVIECAVSDARGKTNFWNDRVKGVNNRMSPPGYEAHYVVEMNTIDNLIPEDTHVDFIKADVEGQEWQAMHGAEKTILRCRPVVIIECKDLCKDYNPKIDRLATVRYLESLGMVVLNRVGDDYILGWK